MARSDTRRVRGGRLIGSHHGGYDERRVRSWYNRLKRLPRTKGRFRRFQGAAARDGWQYWSRRWGMDSLYATKEEATAAAKAAMTRGLIEA